MPLLISLLSFLFIPSLHAAEARVAVAANFLSTLKSLALAFEQSSGHTLVISSGSTGKLYAQIRNGAPFDLLLGADGVYTRRLEEEGALVKGSRFVYARGELVLWGRDNRFAGQALPQVLLDKGNRHIAVANPQTAPYGTAALEYLKTSGLSEQLAPKLVRGESVMQAFQFAASGAAELGFVARAQVLEWQEKQGGGVVWTIPPQHYTPLEQEMGLLKRGERNEAARAFINFLRSDVARAVIRAAGYGVE